MSDCIMFGSDAEVDLDGDEFLVPLAGPLTEAGKDFRATFEKRRKVERKKT